MNELTAPAPYEQPNEQPNQLPGLTAQQTRFCLEYCVDQNGKAAAIRAGYSEASATAMASKNLAKPHIKKHIEDLQDAALEQMGVNRYRVLQELSRIGYSNLRNMFTADGHLINPQDWDDDMAAAISSVEVVSASPFGQDGPIEYTHKIKTWDKPRALEQLGRSLGMGKDEGVNIALQVNISREDADGF